MSNETKIWLIVATALTLVGVLVFVGAMSMIKWDFKKLSTNKYVTNTHEMSESFDSVSISTDVANIEFTLSDSEKCTVTCYEQDKIRHSVEIKDGVLTVQVVDTRKWYEHIGINFDSPKITVSIPRGEYDSLLISTSTGDVQTHPDLKFESIDISTSTGDVSNYSSVAKAINIKTTTGDVCMQSISADTVNISVTTGKITVSDATCTGSISTSVSTGDVRMTNVSCKDLLSIGDTGTITLKNVIAAEKFTIERDTGNVNFEGSDASEIYVKTSTGTVAGTLLSPKVFVVNTDTGRKQVPNTNTGGRCEITTDTGNIIIDLK